MTTIDGPVGSTARTTAATRGAERAPRSARAAPARPTRRTAPILVRQMRGGVEESVHRGDVVEVDVEGALIRGLGDPDRVANLRSCVKPFGVVALIEAGGIEAFDLEPAEIALMASSHSGEDLHVRTLQAMYRRAGVSQGLIATGSEGMPLDALTAARLARDGEKASPVRHMCSGQHSVFLLLSRLKGWDPERYWLDDHPAQVAYRAVVARAFRTTPGRLRTAIDGCGVATYAFPLREIARAYALLADPSAVTTADTRSSLAPALTRVRDAMLAHPEMIGGTRDRLDTSLMKAAPGRVVSKGGMEALRGLAILGGARPGAGGAGRGNETTAAASGIALKIEDGDGHERGTWAATVEVLAQAGVLDGQALRMLARYHRPADLDPHGRTGAEAIPDFELAPLGELL
ncbi:MAG TPA: asparaginase [Candidatus Limnocylindrales bacterium]|nr:asparaginase [Candidatus Limnocylindrales bacterium]